MYTPYRHIGHIFRKSSPIHLTYFVTQRCNAKCPYCFYLQNEDQKTEQKNELQLGEIEKLSISMSNLLWLAFSGGEIFLRKDLAEISEIFYRNNKPVYMLFPSNGIMTERIVKTMRNVVETCKHSNVVLKLSLDGIGDDHDRLRNTKHNFSHLIETYRRLIPLLEKHSNFHVGINSVFCRDNQDTMPDIIEFVKYLKYSSTHTVSMVRGALKNNNYKSFDQKKYFDSIKILEENSHQHTTPQYNFSGGKLKMAQDIIQRQLIYETQRQKKRLIPCFAAKTNLVLTEEGNVFPCELISQSMGNIREYNYNIPELVNSTSAQSVVRDIANSQCYCTHECNTMTNILFNPKQYGKLFKEYIRLSVA